MPKTISSLATRITANGLIPPITIKEVLANQYILPKTNNTMQIIDKDFDRAFLYESMLFALRSMSQVIGYEATYRKGQFSWAIVTLYYANYYSILSMNRMAGEATSKKDSDGTIYRVVAGATPGDYDVTHIKRHDHISVWDANYTLFSDFTWVDTSYDGIIVRVPAGSGRHFERKKREYANYHPKGYSEIFASNAKRKSLTGSYFGRYYTGSPTTVGSLPFTDDWQETIAKMESAVITRQTITMKILSESYKLLQPNSQFEFAKQIDQFAKNIISQQPFARRLRYLYSDFLKEVRN